MNGEKNMKNVKRMRKMENSITTPIAQQYLMHKLSITKTRDDIALEVLKALLINPDNTRLSHAYLVSLSFEIADKFIKISKNDYN